MDDKDRLLFFELTIKYYISAEDAGNNAAGGSSVHRASANSAEKMQNGTPAPPAMHGNISATLDAVFREALDGSNMQILRHFISSLHYNQILVRHLLSHFSPALLSDLLEYSDPSFNILFVHLALKNPHPGLLSKIIPSLYFAPNPRMSDDLLSLIHASRHDLLMLVDPARIPSYDVSCHISISLREYQKDGIRWMAFLNRFGLNGILADNMGLGKTIQVLSYMVSEMDKAGSSTDGPAGAPDSSTPATDGSASLIVCPSSLPTHWESELKTYFNRHSQVYSTKTRGLSSSIIIATYDNIRRDGGVLTDRDWFMIVFDEGHLLKSRSTLLYTKALMLKSARRFILTGTPIHNTVDDLFSLFNIIMPGYLGTEASFSNNYMVKITEKNVDVMEGRLGMLHKKVLPFIMRRLKTEVLKDLPPKIIKDIMVELSAEHADVYASVSMGSNAEGGRIDKGRVGSTSLDSADIGGAGVPTSYQHLKNANALSLTRNMLKAASHPHHFSPGVPSSKTSALRDILAMCGERKDLIFFQLKKTIDLVLDELKITSYLRLDGSLPAAQRGRVVSRFNSESVQYLFLTTSIGGLGLNLVSADTVVFYEHDWNPFNDLQAMDRAHRLGQKRVVNVFRLISKETIEERVMNYQNFKVFVASSIVTQQNTDVEKMDTKDLLERFE